MSSLRTIVRGVGSYLPERVLTNDDLASMVETSDDWIRQRTGIGERRIAAEGETTSTLAVHAARAALPWICFGTVALLVLCDQLAEVPAAVAAFAAARWVFGLRPTS